MSPLARNVLQLALGGLVFFTLWPLATLLAPVLLGAILYWLWFRLSSQGRAYFASRTVLSLLQLLLYTPRYISIEREWHCVRVNNDEPKRFQLIILLSQYSFYPLHLLICIIEIIG
jgi:hypothetical protein